MSTTHRRRTTVLSVHRLRIAARIRERELQHHLDRREPHIKVDGMPVPSWVRGVRVEKAGRFQWAVVGTEWEGR